MAESSQTERDALALARNAAQKHNTRSWFQKAWDSTLGNRGGLSPVTDTVSHTVSSYTGIESPSVKKALPLLAAAAGGFGLFQLTQKFMHTHLGKTFGAITSSVLAAVGGIALNRWLQMPEGTGMKVVVEATERDALVTDTRVDVPKKDTAAVAQEPETHIVTKATLDAVQPPEIRWPDIQRMQVADLNAGHKFAITTSIARHEYQSWEEGMRALDGYFKPYRDDVPRIRDVLQTNGLNDHDVKRLIPSPPATPKLFSEDGHPLGGVDDVSQQLHQHGERIYTRCQHEDWFIDHVKDSNWYKETYSAANNTPKSDPEFGKKVWEHATISTKLNLLNEYHHRIEQTMLKPHEWPQMQLHVDSTTLNIASVARTFLSPLELLGADPAAGLFNKSTLDSLEITESVAEYARKKEAGTLSKYDHARLASIYESASSGGHFDHDDATKRKCALIAESLRCKVLQADLEHFDKDYHQDNRKALESFATERLPIYNQQVDICKENLQMLEKHGVAEFIVAPEDKRQRSLSQAWEAYDRALQQWEDMPTHAPEKRAFRKDVVNPAQKHAMKLAQQTAASYEDIAQRDAALLEVKDCRSYKAGHFETAQDYYLYLKKQDGKTMITAMECIGSGACDLQVHPLEAPVVLGADRGAAFTQAVDQFKASAHARRVAAEEQAREQRSIVIIGKTQMPDTNLPDAEIRTIPQDILIAIDYSKPEAPKRILLKGHVRTANNKSVFKVREVKKTPLDTDAIWDDTLSTQGWIRRTAVPNVPEEFTIGDQSAYKRISDALNGISRMTHAAQQMDSTSLTAIKDVLGVVLANNQSSQETDSSKTPNIPSQKPHSKDHNNSIV